MSNSLFKGVYTALITPFKDSAIDEASLKQMIRFQVDQGINGLVINGTTAESPTLSKSEVKKIFEIAKAEVSGQVPLLLGAGSNSTQTTMQNVKDLNSLHPDGFLIVVPYYNKPPQSGMKMHFNAVADVSEAPIMLYNVPGRTVVSMNPETAADLSEHPNIGAIKDATADLAQMKTIKSKAKEGFVVSSGDDDTCVDFCLQGGDGVVSVISNILPGPLVNLIHRAIGKDESAKQDYAKYQKLLKLLYCEPNPMPCKMAAYQMGLIQSPELRLPLHTMTEPNAHQLKSELQSLEIL